MSAQGMSERAYARHMGRSRGSVQKLRAAGRLVFFPDGSIDPAASDLRRAQTARRTTPSSAPTPERAECPGCGDAQPAERHRRRRRHRRGTPPSAEPQLMIEVLRIYTLA